MQQTSESLRTWFRDVQPMCVELFNAAYVMCGNYDMAEYALRSAILDVWLQNASGGMGFRERLRAALRREAFAAALSEDGLAAEADWPGPGELQKDDPVAVQLGQAPLETQRLVMLRHGCGLSLRAIDQLTGVAQGRIRTELNRFQAHCRRRLPGQSRAKTEAMIARQARRLLAQGGPNTPHPSQIYRAFEAEAATTRNSGSRFLRVLGGLLLVLMALLCAGAFWLFAVLVQPA